MYPVLADLATLAQSRQRAFDDESGALLDGYRQAGGRLYCGRGCRSCCSLAIHGPLPEALALAAQLPADLEGPLNAYVARLRREAGAETDWLPYLRRHRQAVGPCPFLGNDGACGVYAARPLTCRALLSTRPADWCAVDFADLDDWDRRSYLASLDPAVVAWPTHYLASPQQHARGLEQELLDATAGALGLRLAGNFPLLVWLLRQRPLAQALLAGTEAVRTLLAREGFAGPPPVDLQDAPPERRHDV